MAKSKSKKSQRKNTVKCAQNEIIKQMAKRRNIDPNF